MELNAAITALVSTTQLLSAGLKARDDAKVKAAQTELQERLFTVMTAALAQVEKAGALVAENAALKAAQAEQSERLADLERKIVDRANYSLCEVRPGAFAYASKRMDDGSEPAHYLCQACYDKGLKVVLQLVPERAYVGAQLVCGESPTHMIAFAKQTPPPGRATIAQGI